MDITDKLIENKQLFQEKARGCLIGLAIGDAMGDIGRDDAYRKRYGIITDLYAGTQSTDDTEFAALTALTLIDCNGLLTPEAVFQSWKKRILDVGGVRDRGGRPLHGAVANLERGLRAPQSGRDNVLNNDDGAAMRIAPVGIVFAGDPAAAAAAAEIEAQISHADDGIWAAQAVAAAVAAAMVGASPDEIISAGIAQIPKDSWLGRAMGKAMDICEAEGSIRGAWHRLHADLWTPEHAASEEAIPQCFAILRLTGIDYKEAMFWAANFGRDADTIGAVVGAIAGARSGVGVIPEPWIERARRPAGVCLRFAADTDIIELADQLVPVGQARAAGA